MPHHSTFSKNRHGGFYAIGMRASATCSPWFAVAESSLPVPLNTFAARSLKFPVPLRRELLCKTLSNLRFRSRAEPSRHQNCGNSLIFSLLAGYLMRKRVRIRLPPPPRTLLPAGRLHALANCASVQRLSAAVSGGLRLRRRGGARFPRLSTARLRLLETVSRSRKQRWVLECRRPVRIQRVFVQQDAEARPACSVAQPGFISALTKPEYVRGKEHQGE